jgi:hypothetical protein
MTYALRGARCATAHTLAAPIATGIALMALAALGLPGEPVHEPVNARYAAPCNSATLRNVTGSLYRGCERGRPGC